MDRKKNVIPQFFSSVRRNKTKKILNPRAFFNKKDLRNLSMGATDDGIECTTDSIMVGMAGCFGFLLSLVVVTALGVTAAGVFWTAHNVDRVTSGNYLLLDVEGVPAM